MSKRLIIILLLLVGGFGVLFVLTSQNRGSQNEQSLLRPVDAFQHAHGLAVDIADSSKVYIATHNGLFMLQNDQKLYQVGSKTDDYMGFSTHPTESKTFYTSGHPKTGGNIGFQKTTDGGRSWEQVSSGADGPVDFHALTVSRANPNTVYGWYAGKLQRSLDGGKEWQIMDSDLEGVISLVSDPIEPKTVFATTTTGIQKSSNEGKTWTPVAPEVQDTAVTVLAINPSNSSEWVSYSEKLGLAKSIDGGQTWNQLTLGKSNDPILHIAYDIKAPSTLYALSQANTISKTMDGGLSWQTIR